MALDKNKIKVGDIIRFTPSENKDAEERCKLWRGRIIESKSGGLIQTTIVDESGSRISEDRIYVPYSEFVKEDYDRFTLEFDLDTAEELKPTALRSASDYMKELGYGS